MPSAVGYQPTLQTEMGALQERITSTKHGVRLVRQFDLGVQLLVAEQGGLLAGFKFGPPKPKLRR